MRKTMKLEKLQSEAPIIFLAFFPIQKSSHIVPKSFIESNFVHKEKDIFPPFFSFLFIIKMWSFWHGREHNRSWKIMTLIAFLWKLENNHHEGLGFWKCSWMSTIVLKRVWLFSSLEHSFEHRCFGLNMGVFQI